MERHPLNIRLTLACALLPMLVIGAGGIFRLEGQAATATIQGTVTDSSGAAVPGAAVQAKSTGTGATQSTTTDGQGRFNLPDLAVGGYDVQASKTGFTTVIHPAITLAVGSQSVVDFSLPVGQQTQTVTVQGEASAVETTNATVGSYVNQQQMRELPLNGRNFEQLIALTPGVQSIGGNAFISSGFQGRAPEFSIAGSRPTGQAILLDDESLQNFWNKGMGSVLGSSLGVEAIGEFETLTNTYSARFGGNGGMINAVSRSGSNAWHGSGYYFLRNSALDARAFIDPATIPAFRRHQFGGSIGGPIKKDKAFFFVNYEGIRQLLGETQIAFVPGCNLTPAACVPSFPRSSNPTGYDAIVNTLAIFPNATSVVGGQPRATSVASQTGHENYVLGRVDYIFSDKDSLFARYISDKSDLTEPFGGGAFGGNTGIAWWPEEDFSHMQFATAEERHIFSPTLINVARISFSRPSTNEFTGPTAPGGLVNGKDPLQYFAGSGRQDGIVQISGLSGIGGALQLPFNTTQNRYTEADDITWTHGAHTVRLGASISRLQTNTFMPFFQGAQWNFSSLQGFRSGVPDLLLFVPLGSYPNRDFRDLEFTPYGEDTWKISPKLTLNLGLRWEYVTNPVDQHNQLYWVPNFDTAAPPNLWTNVSHVMEHNPANKNFAPRVGFAYDPFADHKTSIRAGFGIFREVISVYNFAPAFWAAKPWSITAALPLPFLPPLNYPAIPGFGFDTPSAFPGWDYHIKNTPYVMQYNLNIQREIVQNTVFNIGYVGSRGVHLLTMQEQNPPTVCTFAQGPGCANPTYANGFLGGYLGSACTSPAVQHCAPGTVVPNPRRNPNLGQFPDLVADSTSRYNSLLVSLTRRFSNNVQGQASYTFSRCIDDGGYLPSFNTNGTGAFMDPYHEKLDKGPCSFDINHVFKINSLVALPFRGNKLVEGWEITGIFSWSSGLPINIYDGYDQASGSTGALPLTPRPNLNPGFSNNPIVGKVDEWFNPLAFSIEAPGTFGNLGRSTVRGPRFVNTDFGVLKDTKILKISESFVAQFRAEFFNIFNHTNLGLPVQPGSLAGAALFGPGGVRLPSAGQITSMVGTPRQIQFALKLIF